MLRSVTGDAVNDAIDEKSASADDILSIYCLNIKYLIISYV